MMPPEEDSGILQNLEFAVARLWRRHPEMTDYVARRAYEAAHQRYRGEARGHAPKPCALTGLDRETFDAISAICEFRLGRKPPPDGSGEPIPPVPLTRLVDCFSRLRKSVKFHTERGGRQGYLTFVDRFTP